MASKAQKLWMVLEEQLVKSEGKGYKMSKLFGIIKQYQTLAKLSEKTSLQETIESLNSYLKPHKLVVFTTRKGVFVTREGNYSPSVSINIEL